MEEKAYSKVQVMDLTIICQSFPRLPEPLIPRDNLLNTIEVMLGDEIELVMVEGSEGLGENYTPRPVCAASSRSYILGFYQDCE